MTDTVPFTGDCPPFTFVADPSVVAAQATKSDVVVRVPIGIARQRSLFRCFDAALRFPGYFGWNWDAFRNCLLDLSWLDPATNRVVIIHNDLPFVPGQRDLAIYLSILGEASGCSSEPLTHVVFPEIHAACVRRLWLSRA